MGSGLGWSVLRLYVRGSAATLVADLRARALFLVVRDPMLPSCPSRPPVLFVQCSKAAQAQIKGRFQGLFAQGLKAYFTRG